MIKAVLFDLDGTLINTNDLIIESFKYTVKKHLNKDIDEREIVKYFGEPLMTTLERFDSKNADKLFETYIDYNESRHDFFAKPFEGTVEAVDKLRSMGIKVGIVTSKRRVIAQRGIDLIKLTDSLDGVVTIEDTVKKKPDGEPALKGCEVLNTKPEETIMVGDSHYDIMCGRNAGCLTCIVKYTALDLKFLMKYNPDYAVDKLMDIAEIIKEENCKAV